MTTFPGPNNPIVYAQFRLQGGWRGVGLLAGICTAILGGILVLSSVSAAGSGASLAAVVSDWPQGLIVLQTILLLIVAPLRVVSAIRTDVTNRMIESHRLMPVTPLGVVAGYVVGGPWAVVVLAATTFVFGTACCLVSGHDPSPWFLANIALAVAAGCVWIVTAHLSMVSRLGVLLLVVIAVFGLSGTGGPGQLLPGFSVLTATLVSRSTLALRGTVSHADAWACALLAQVAVGAISGLAAVRIYRRPGSIGLSTTLGLLLLSLWVTTSVLGIHWPAVFSYRRYRGPSLSAQLVASLVTGLLMSAMPIAAAARAAKALTGPACRGDGLAPVTVGVIAALILSVLPWAAQWDQKSDSFFELPSPERLQSANLFTPAVLLATTLGLAFLFRWTFRRWERGWPAASAWVIVVWIAPLLVNAAVSLGSGEAIGPVATLSPIGALVVLWTRSDTKATLGVALQFALAAVASFMGMVVRGRRTVTTDDL